MSVTMTIDANKEMDLKGDFDTIFDELAQVEKMASMFPKVERLVNLGDNTYRWEMEKAGFSKYTMQLIYAVKYEIDKTKGTIAWKPVPGVGNAVHSGQVKITPTAGGVHIVLSSKIDMELPIPKLAKPLVTPVIMHEFNATTEKFEARMRKHFNS